MRHYIFTQDFNIETVKPLCQWISETKEKSKLYLSSDGGNIDSSLITLDLLNMYHDLIDIHIVEFCSSCAFTLCLGFKGKVTVSDIAESTVHLINMQVNTISLKDKNSIVNKKINNTPLLFEERYKEFLTPKEFKEIKLGKDIYLNTNRLKQIFKDS